MIVEYNKYNDAGAYTNIRQFLGGENPEVVCVDGVTITKDEAGNLVILLPDNLRCVVGEDGNKLVLEREVE